MTAEILRHLAYLLGLDLMAGGLLLLAYGVTGLEWFKSVFRAWDYGHAAIAGGDGKHSVSAYCGANNTRIHRIGRAIIDGLFGTGHCTQAALREGLLKP